MALLNDVFRKDEDKQLRHAVEEAPFLVVRLGQAHKHASLSEVMTEIAKRRCDMGRATWFIRSPHMAPGDHEYSPRFVGVLKQMYPMVELEAVTTRFELTAGDEPASAPRQSSPSTLTANQVARGVR